MVEDEGCAVIEARTVDDAFNFLAICPSLELMIADIETPGSMDGCQLTWEEVRRWPHICVVDRPEVGDLPPSAIFIPKPISVDVVYEAIEEYCGHCDVR